MRLTLRTLLAWLDDTLPPEEVREIGTQVSETPYAQSLIERIRKVTRQRRLTVPPNSGPEAVDPNTVAAYLDNELEAEKVAEYEALCLNSDVHLAEAASCHQILSLIKNKAKVPPEARYRMYRLFKGPEAVRTNYRATAGGSVVPSVAEATPAKPPWARASEPERPSLLERVGPPLAAVALIGVLLLVGLANLRDAGVTIREFDSVAAQFAAEPEPAPEAVEPAEPDRVRPEPFPVAGRTPAPPIVAEPSPEPDEPDEPDAEPVEPPAPMPEGVVAVVEQADGVALRGARAGAARTWERLEAGRTLAPGDRVVTLAPFRTTLAVGPVRLTMIAQSELRVERPERGNDPRVTLLDGSVVLRSAEPDRALDVDFEGRTITLRLPVGRPIGLSWMGLKAPGEPAGRPLLTILCPAGATLTASVDGDDPPRSFDGPTLISVDPEDGFLGDEPAVMPRWLVDPEPQPADIQAGEAFAALFEQSTGSITFTLLEGAEDPDPTVRSLSIAALGAMGHSDPEAMEQVLAQLNRVGDPAARGTALGVVIRQISRGPEAAERMREQLRRFLAPPEAADDLDRLITGIPADRVGDEEVSARLVADLSSPNPSVRQLALETLLLLTGREDHGYDPDAPGGDGLKFWQDLLKSGRLIPPGRPRAGPPAGGAPPRG